MICPYCGGYRSSVTGYCSGCYRYTYSGGGGGGRGLMLLIVGGAILFGALIVISLLSLVGGLLLTIIVAWVASLRQVGAPPAAYAVSALVGVLALIVYLMPGIVASKRHTRKSIWVWVVDMFFGWTLIGWMIALAMAIGGKTHARSAVSRQGALGAPAMVSQDGQWWWDGRQWYPMPTAPLSQDWQWWWDGRQWNPLPPPLLPPTR